MSSNRNQGIRLPPISFLSNQYLQNLQQHQQQQLPLQLLTSPQISTTKLTPASNIGIQMYLNNPSSQSPNIASLSPPQSNEDNVNKNLETLASPPQILSSVSQNRPPPSQQQQQLPYTLSRYQNKIHCIRQFNLLPQKYLLFHLSYFSSF